MSKIMLFALVVALACCVNALPNPQFSGLFGGNLFKPLDPGYIEKLGRGSNGMSSSDKSWVGPDGKVHHDRQVTTNDGGKVNHYNF